MLAIAAPACGPEVEGTKSTGATTSAGPGGAGVATTATTTTASGAGGGLTGVGAGGGLPVLDAGLDDMGCSDRPEGCIVPEDPSTPDYQQKRLQALTDMCGLCGQIQVTFDAMGCATTLAGWGGGDFQKAVACIAQGLDAERWSCAAGMTLEVNADCTVK